MCWWSEIPRSVERKGISKEWVPYSVRKGISKEWLPYSVGKHKQERVSVEHREGGNRGPKYKRGGEGSET